MSIDNETLEKYESILNEPFKDCDFEETDTVRDVLKDLLKVLLVEQERFSGKRPFGNSGLFSGFEVPIGKHFPEVVKVDDPDEYGDIDSKIIDMTQYDKILIGLVDKAFV